MNSVIPTHCNNMQALIHNIINCNLQCQFHITETMFEKCTMFYAQLSHDNATSQFPPLLSKCVHVSVTASTFLWSNSSNTDDCPMFRKLCCSFASCRKSSLTKKHQKVLDFQRLKVSNICPEICFAGKGMVHPIYVFRNPLLVYSMNPVFDIETIYSSMSSNPHSNLIQLMY